MELREILSRCDHTLLRVDATAAEIRALCDQGMRYGCASVCIPPCHVAGAKKYVGDRLRICTVIGFPNGYNTPAVKAFEAADAKSREVKSPNTTHRHMNTILRKAPLGGIL